MFSAKTTKRPKKYAVGDKKSSHAVWKISTQKPNHATIVKFHVVSSLK